jgi:hypothetical protein
LAAFFEPGREAGLVAFFDALEALGFAAPRFAVLVAFPPFLDFEPFVAKIILLRA